ncbi:MAG TPA: asparagine--tRNA ligase, partial [Desulfuromonadales bacterium]|nr:asparagine--tRNA ligase [Desulfuromonadales bacterium]
MGKRIKYIVENGVPGTAYTISGWIRSLRSSKQITFIDLNDGSNLSGIQVTIESDCTDFAEASRAGTGSALKVDGVLVESLAAGQKMELQAHSIEIIGPADTTYPLQKKRHTFEYLRTIAHLRPRTNTFGAVFRLRSKLAQEIHR